MMSASVCAVVKYASRRLVRSSRLVPSLDVMAGRVRRWYSLQYCWYNHNTMCSSPNKLVKHQIMLFPHLRCLLLHTHYHSDNPTGFINMYTALWIRIPSQHRATLIRVHAAGAAAVGHHFTAVSNHLSLARSLAFPYIYTTPRPTKLTCTPNNNRSAPACHHHQKMFSPCTRTHAKHGARVYVCPLEDCWTAASWRFSAFAQSPCVHERNICAICGALCEAHCKQTRTRTHNVHAISRRISSAVQYARLSPILSGSNNLGDR